MNRTLLTIVCIFIFLQFSIAQQQHIQIFENSEDSFQIKPALLNPDKHFTCGTDEHHEFLMRTNEAYRKSFLRHSQQIDSVLNNIPSDRSSSPLLYTIPVVVHVINLGEPIGTGSNISDAQILDAITGLNERYANANGQGIDCEINFCLASRTPDGCPTNGIIRVNGSGVPDYAADGIEFSGTCGASESAIKALSHWPPLEYYNIWVVLDICGDWAGYAAFPNGGELDGTVIGCSYMTRDAKTLAHELGHGLNIRHSFNGDNGGSACPVNNNCLADGDAICDTPPHRRQDCGATNPCTNEGIWYNSLYNWMSYCDIPANIGRFTPDQSTRMQASLMVYPRNELLNSMGCTHIGLPAITSDDNPLCFGEQKSLTATPPGGEFLVVSGPGIIENDELIATGEGTILIQYVRCIDTASQSIQAFQNLAPYFTSTGHSMCSGTTQIISAEPSGGDFTVVSGPGILNGNELSAMGPGTIVLNYFMSINGCSGNAQQEIIVEPIPVAEIISSDQPMCIGQERLLSGSPDGGDFYIVSGPAYINGNILIPEGIGTVVIGYHIELNGCTGSTIQSILIDEIPVPEIISGTQRMCSGDERILNAIPPGGSFSILSGPGVITQDTLLANGAGEIQIQYTVNQNGCSAIAPQTIPAQQSPGVIFNNPQDHICLGDSIALSASPQGGIFQLQSDLGELNGNILSASSEGDLLIDYTITQNGCTGSGQKLMYAVETPQPEFTMDTSVICKGSSRALTASPTGGIFWIIGGPGSIGNAMLTSRGEGLIKLGYLLNQYTCVRDASQSIVSKRTPNVEFTTDSLSICIGQAYPVDILPEMVQLNLLSGPGALNDHLLTSTDSGVIVLTGQFEENGCVGTDTLTIFSNAIPEPGFIITDSVICIGSSIQLSGLPAGGIFEVLSGPGSIHQNTLTGFNPGNIQIVYKVVENNCAASVEDKILAIDPVAEIIVSRNLLISVDTTGVFKWLDCDNNFEPLSAESGDTLIITRAGSYALVNGVGDCIDTSACVWAGLTSLPAESSEQGIHIYPNPVSSCFFIQMPEDLQVEEVNIMNAFGENVYAQHDWYPGNCLDMSCLGSGVYFVDVKCRNEQHYVVRMVKI